MSKGRRLVGLSWGVFVDLSFQGGFRGDCLSWRGEFVVDEFVVAKVRRE